VTKRAVGERLIHSGIRAGEMEHILLIEFKPKALCLISTRWWHWCSEEPTMTIFDTAIKCCLISKSAKSVFEGQRCDSGMNYPRFILDIHCFFHLLFAIKTLVFQIHSYLLFGLKLVQFGHMSCW